MLDREGPRYTQARRKMCSLGMADISTYDSKKNDVLINLGISKVDGDMSVLCMPLIGFGH